MNHLEVRERGVEDMGTIGEVKTANRLLLAMKHPDCPLTILERKASQLARFLAVRLHRMKGSK